MATVQALSSLFPSELPVKAEEFLAQMAEETGDRRGLATRLKEVKREILSTGTYHQTFEELEFGVKVAWRNSIRCVGRLYWPSLKLIDHRELSRFDEIAPALEGYLRGATNLGKIQPTIAVFAPRRPGERGARIWNDQLIRYAGWRQRDGSILGDPLQLEVTAEIERLGWQPGHRTAFDVLPVVLDLPGEPPRWFELDRRNILEVPLVHPSLPAFAELDLRWHAVPSIASMCLEVGGISYTMAPFNGWYMSAEIGARNLADEGRYNLLPKVAQLLGLDTRKERTLWRDRALVELNVAVLHSFERVGVKIVDHHTVSEHFLRFEEKERQCGRETYAEWSWVVPPISGSTSPLFHHTFEAKELSPNFFYQPAPWRNDGRMPGGKKCPFHAASHPNHATRPDGEIEGRA